MAALMAATLRHMHIKKPSSQTLPLSQIAKLLVALSLVGAKHDQKTPKSKNDVPPFLVARDVLSLVHVCRGGVGRAPYPMALLSHLVCVVLSPSSIVRGSVSLLSFPFSHIQLPFLGARFQQKKCVCVVPHSCDEDVSSFLPHMVPLFIIVVCHL